MELRVERLDLDGETAGAVRAAVLAADVVAVSVAIRFTSWPRRGAPRSVRPPPRRSRPERSTSAYSAGVIVAGTTLEPVSAWTAPFAPPLVLEISGLRPCRRTGAPARYRRRRTERNTAACAAFRREIRIVPLRVGERGIEDGDRVEFAPQRAPWVLQHTWLFNRLVLCPPISSISPSPRSPTRPAAPSSPAWPKARRPSTRPANNSASPTSPPCNCCPPGNAPYSPCAKGSAGQRARPAPRSNYRPPPSTAPPARPRTARTRRRSARAHPRLSAEAAVVDAFCKAWADADIPRIIALLSDDVLLTMPPMGLRFEGAQAVGEFFATQPMDGRLDRITLTVTRANGQPTLASYATTRPTASWSSRYEGSGSPASPASPTTSRSSPSWACQLDRQRARRGRSLPTLTAR